MDFCLKSSASLWLVSSFFLFFAFKDGLVRGQSVTAEGQAQAVEVKIYPADEDEWTATSLVQRIALVTGQSYCSASPINCGLASFSGFNDTSDVVISSPTKDGSSVVVSVYIRYPAGDPVHPNSSTQYVLPSTATTAILQNTREGYHQETGLWMTYINGQYFSFPPDVEVNQAVIPVAFLVVFGAGITAALLNYHEKRKEKRDKLKRRMQEKKKFGTTNNYVNSNYNILETTNTTVLSNTPRLSRYNDAKIVPDDSVNYATWNVEKEAPTFKSVPQISTMPSVNEFHSQETPRSKNGLKPLEKETDLDAREREEEKKERRRRRKEKRREKQRLREMEVYENRALDSSVLSDNENNVSGTAIHTFSVEKEPGY